MWGRCGYSGQGWFASHYIGLYTKIFSLKIIDRLPKQKKKKCAELRFIVTCSKVHGKENETQKVVFLYFAKAWQFWMMSCFYNKPALVWPYHAGASRGHSHNIFLRHLRHNQNKIQLKKHIKVTVLRCTICCIQRDHRLTVLIYSRCEGWCFTSMKVQSL